MRERLRYKGVIDCIMGPPQAFCCQADLPRLCCRSQVLEQSLAWLRSEAVVHSGAAATALAAVALLQELPSSQVRPGLALPPPCCMHAGQMLC